MKIRFVLNGLPVSSDVATSDNAVDVLRRDFGMFSVRQTCGQGLCGACTVLVGGEPMSACLLLAPRLDGEEVQTVEGLSDDPARLDPLQEAFCAEGAFQCGYCTPGMVLMAKTLLREHPRPDERTIRAYMSGNICRCCSYPEIVRAIQCAAGMSNGAAAAPAPAGSAVERRP